MPDGRRGAGYSPGGRGVPVPDRRLRLYQPGAVPGNGLHGCETGGRGSGHGGAPARQKISPARISGQTAEELVKAGYRVVMPDQIGFGKSSKPGNYQYSFQQLAQNTHALLASIGVESSNVLGHSMGGMLAVRYALMYPDETQSLTLLNPIGLEDWKAKGVPYQSVDAWYQSELKKTPEKIRAYQLDSYYDGQWKDAYDPWVEQLAQFIESPAYPTMAWNQALTYDMIYTQPVIYELENLEVPVLLIIGQRDTTALGKNRVSPEVRKQLGNYPKLGRAAARAIPESVLVELDGIGHLPHIEAFDRFLPPYLAFLKAADAETPAERRQRYEDSSKDLVDHFMLIQSLEGAGNSPVY